MIKPLIKLRQYTWLPIKWALKFRKESRSFEIRSNDEILFALDELKNNLLEAERIDDRVKIAEYKAMIKLMNWLMVKKDGSTKI